MTCSDSLSIGEGLGELSEAVGRGSPLWGLAGEELLRGEGFRFRYLLPHSSPRTFLV